MKKTGNSNRILALDILRGITIAGMILVNNPGSWGHIYAPLDHAEWLGLTPTDFVFPFFMFIMGITTYISLRKYDFQASTSAVRKIVVRTVVIILVGSFISFFAHFCYYWNNADPLLGFGAQFLDALNVLPTLRFTGVLHRLAVCYCVVAILALIVKHKFFPWIITCLFVSYFIVLQVANGYAYDETNILSIFDRAIIPVAHLYNDHGIDPEGLLSTIPSIAHVMIGFVVGRMMFVEKKQSDIEKTMSDIIQTKSDIVQTKLDIVITRLFVIGTALLISGFLLSYACPISKKIWTPTFSMVTCGFASMFLALLIYIIDKQGIRKGSGFFASFGANPLFLYIMSDVFAILLGCIKVSGISIHGHIYNALVPLFGETGGSCVYAILFVIFNFAVVAYPLYKRKIYIKI